MGHALPAGSWGGVVLPGSRETLTATHICGEAGAMLGTTPVLPGGTFLTQGTPTPALPLTYNFPKTQAVGL